MSFGDKIEAKKDELVGGAKEKIGDATDNESMQAEGAAQETKGDAKGAFEKGKDAVKDVFDGDK